MGRREIERPADLDLGTMVRMVRRHAWLGDPSKGGPRGGRTTVFANGVIEEVVEGPDAILPDRRRRADQTR